MCLQFSWLVVNNISFLPWCLLKARLCYPASVVNLINSLITECKQMDDMFTLCLYAHILLAKCMFSSLSLQNYVLCSKHTTCLFSAIWDLPLKRVYVCCKYSLCFKYCCSCLHLCLIPTCLEQAHQLAENHFRPLMKNEI